MSRAISSDGKVFLQLIVSFSNWDQPSGLIQTTLARIAIIWLNLALGTISGSLYESACTNQLVRISLYESVDHFG
jgi:hypothetical protein